MAKAIFGLTLSNATDATFRAWGSALSAQIGAMLTRVVQTGDINWTTVLAPLANSTFMGSEVFRFNDGLQSTAPIFIKIEYGAGAGTTGAGLRFTVGKSADGAGNIGGVLLAATIVVSHVGAGTVNNCYISAGASWFALSLDPLTNGGLVMIERSILSGGTPTGDALLVGWQWRAGNNQEYRFIDYTAATAESVSSGIVAIPIPLSTDRSIANGTTTPVFPAACISPAGVFWRPRVLLGTARQNAGLGEVISSLLDGNTYLGLGVGAQRTDQRGGTFATALIRWD
jgi:hypothetical protein